MFDDSMLSLHREEAMRTLFIALSLCIASMAYAQQPIKGTKDNESKQQAAQDKRGTKEQPLVIEGISAQQDQTVSREQREYRAQQIAIGAAVRDALNGVVEEAKKAVEEAKTTAKLTLALFVATLVLAVVTWCLIRSGERNAQQQLRAYVGVSAPKLIIKRESSADKLLVIMGYINAGQTPGKYLSLHMRAKAHDFFKENGPKPPWEVPRNTKDEGKGGSLLPGVTWFRHCEVEDFSPSLIRELREKRKTIWVWGTIDYIDIFDKPSNVQFRFSSSDFPRDFDVPEHGGKVDGYALIADAEYTKAVYGKKA
jgi:hypothetical protein